MRLSPLLCVCLFSLLAWVQLACAGGRSSEDVDALMSNDTGSEEEVSSHGPANQGALLHTDTAAHLREGQLLPPRNDPVPETHPELGRLRLLKEGTKRGPLFRTSSTEVVRVPGGPPPQPALREKQPKEEARKRARWLGVRRGERGEASGRPEPVYNAPEEHIEEENRERYRELGLQEDEPRRPSRRPLLRTNSGDRLEQSLFPFFTPPSSSHHIPVRQGAVLRGIPIDHATVPAQEPLPPPDSFLVRMFQPPHSIPAAQFGFEVRPGTYSIEGLRYGHIPAHPPLPPPPPGVGNARVLLPEDVRWVFPETEHRQRAYAIAQDVGHKLMVRRTMAGEARRLYAMEASKIREAIDRRSELPLYTSNEWRDWISEHGPNVLVTQLDSKRIRNMGAEIVDAQHRLALRIQGAHLPAQATIPLSGEHERAVANHLVTWWTSAHDHVLEAALGSVR